MYEFFERVSNMGISHPKMAERMGVHYMTYYRVMTGANQPGYEFMGKATTALRDMGVRKKDGGFYTVDDLFYSVVAQTA